MKCPKCHVTINPTSTYCVFCGQVVNFATLPRPAPRHKGWITMTLEYWDPEGTNLLGMLWSSDYAYITVHGRPGRQRLESKEIDPYKAALARDGWELISSRTKQDKDWSVTYYEYRHEVTSGTEFPTRCSRCGGELARHAITCTNCRTPLAAGLDPTWQVMCMHYRPTDERTRSSHGDLYSIAVTNVEHDFGVKSPDDLAWWPQILLAGGWHKVRDFTQPVNRNDGSWLVLCAVYAKR